MFSKTRTKQQMRKVKPIKTMWGHSGCVQGIVHLPGGRRIITCSLDGSLRLWDLKSGAQIGKSWRDEGEKPAAVYGMALSPSGQTVVSGSDDGKVRLWDVEMGKVVAKWTGHTEGVVSVCWSAGGDRVLSGSRGGMARVWDVKTREAILEIETGQKTVFTVIYSPDNTKIASTGGFGKAAVKIWDAKTGKLFAELKHDWGALSLAWTSDGKIIVSAHFGPIRIFDTATGKQIATLECHLAAHTIVLSRNNRLLASISFDNTAQLWNLDTNLPVEPPLQHKHALYHLFESGGGIAVGSCPPAFSLDGKVLVTGGRSRQVFVWDIHAIFKQAGLEDILSTDTNIALDDILEQKAFQSEPGIERTPRSSLSDKSFLEADATRCHNEFGNVDELSSRFFDGMEFNVDSSPTGGAHPHSSASALLARLASLLHRFRPDSAEANEPWQPPTLSGLHLRVLFARLSSFIHRSLPEHDSPNELQQLSTPSRLHLHVILARLSSFFPRSQLNTEDTEPHTVTPSHLRPNALMDLLSSRFRSQHHTNEDIELSQYTTRLHVVDVAPMRDREVLFVAERAQVDRPHYQSAGTATPGARPVHSRPIRLLGHIGLFLCCVCNHQHTDGSAQPTQQQHGQSQGPVSTQVSSLQTTPAAVSTSTTPTVPTTTPAAATP